MLLIRCSCITDINDDKIANLFFSVETNYIQLKEMGSESIEVSDNGSGIDPSNYSNIALKHHTSKLCDFIDLNSVSSFGFRGEALNALCELSGMYFHAVFLYLVPSYISNA